MLLGHLGVAQVFDIGSGNNFVSADSKVEVFICLLFLCVKKQFTDINSLIY